MKKNKILALLSSFTPGEMRELSAFVNSPYINKHEGIRRLMAALTKAYPGFDPEDCSREKLFEQVFGSEYFDYQKISDLLTYLLRLAEQFLASKEFESDTFTQSLFQLRQLRKRNLEKSFHQKTIYINGLIPVVKSASDYYHLFLLEAESVSYHIQQKIRSEDESFLRMTTNLDLYYLISRLQLGCGMLNRQDVQDTGFDLSLVSLFVDYLETQKPILTENPLIKVYLYIFRMLEKKEDTYRFNQTRQFVADHFSLFPRNILREIYAYMMNYCIHRINHGELGFQETLFALYQWQLETGIIFEAQFLSPWDYKNIANLGLKLKKFEWVENFVRQYQQHLPEPFRKHAFLYNQSMLYFEKGEYTSSLRLLREVEFDDIYHQIGAKTMLLKIYFEKNDFEALFYHIDAFEAYLKRQKEISAYQKELYLNFIRFTRKLAHLTAKGHASYRLIKPAQIQVLREKILGQKNVAQSTWLISHTDKLLSFLKNY